MGKVSAPQPGHVQNVGTPTLLLQSPPQQQVYGPPKSRIVAGILGLLLGGLGVHKFYLGNIGLGIVYLIFSWTFVPAIIGFIEGIIDLVQSDSEFAYKQGPNVQRS